MVNSSIILNDFLCSYETDVENVMMQQPKVYNGHAMVPYKNSKV